MSLPLGKPDRQRLEHIFMEEANQYNGFGAPPPFEDDGICAGVES